MGGHEIAGLALATLIGLSLGLLGGGGSILTVPILVYVAGFEAKQGVVMSLVVVGTTALTGALAHWRERRVRWRTAAAFAPAAIIGGYAGARIGVLLAGAVQLAILGVVMLAAAAAMFTDRSDPTAPRAPARLPVTSLIGFGVGLLTGVVGVGGGFLIVPALVLLAALPIKQAVATSLVVIAANTASAFAGYAGHVAVPWSYLALFTAFAIGGSLVGARLVAYVSQRALRRSFAVFLVVMACFVLYKNRGVF